MYPPRFHYCITQGSHSDEIKFEFSGFDSEVSYTISVTPFAGIDYRPNGSTLSCTYKVCMLYCTDET